MTANGLRGRTALVTGGSRGIGAAISRALAEAGAAVAINYRARTGEANKLAEDLRKTGVNVITVQADVSDTRTLQAYLGHRSIQPTVGYTELAPGRFKNIWR